MNVVLRLQTNWRSLILKQSRPYVRKYPDIPAPANRIDVEHRFYQAISQIARLSCFPKIAAYDATQHLLLMEDLGQTEDLTRLYASRNVPDILLDSLAGALAGIHTAPAPSDFPDNLELRRLNHQHIFVLPFLPENGFSLDTVQPGLEGLAAPLREDAKLKARVAALGDAYLEQGQTLLHGDFYPGSWVEAGNALFIIDPEFSFMGFPEFDLGVMAAHLYMSGMDPELARKTLGAYPLPYREETALQVAGTEVVRRLIGLAQLPLERSLEEKETLLKTARQWIMA